MRNRTFPASWDAQQREGEVAVVVEEAVTGVRVVKGFGQEQRELDRLVERAQTLYGSRLRSVRLQARYQPVLQAIPVFGQVAVLAVGGWLALQGEITVGTFLAFSTYLLQLASPARMLAGVLIVGQQARAGAERVLDLLASNPVVTERPDADDLPPVLGEISFEDVRFGYLSSQPVLDHFDLHIGAGETVALVGASGSGKSTVALLLPRFYDVQSGVGARGWQQRPGSDTGLLAWADRRRVRGELPLLGHGWSQYLLRSTGRHTPPRSRPRRGPPRLTTSSWSCLPATTPKWASGASPFPGASGRGSPWPGRC